MVVIGSVGRLSIIAWRSPAIAFGHTVFVFLPTHGDIHPVRNALSDHESISMHFYVPRSAASNVRCLISTQRGHSIVAVRSLFASLKTIKSLLKTIVSPVHEIPNTLGQLSTFYMFYTFEVGSDVVLGVRLAPQIDVFPRLQ